MKIEDTNYSFPPAFARSSRASLTCAIDNDVLIIELRLERTSNNTVGKSPAVFLVRRMISISGSATGSRDYEHLPLSVFSSLRVEQRLDHSFPTGLP